MNVTEFAIAAEVCTATMTSNLETGESYDGPISIGFYPGSTEVWIQHGGHTINIQADHIDAFCKQLKRAKTLAKDKP